MPDCLIVHAPKFQNRYKPLGNYTSTQWMALGVFALADALQKSGLSARIVHLGLEKNLDPRFTIARYLSENPCRVVAFSCHFHQQLYDTLRAARCVKAHDPSIYVVMGGMTSSYFAEDILAAHPQVDAVIRGEGERPLEQLVSAVVHGDSDMSKVANLVWREGGEIRKNEQTYFASRDDLDPLDFCNLSLMDHYAQYVEMPKIVTRLALPAKLRWKVSSL
ncbi:MAG: cobalamin-dependent protein, partial [bacterium]